MLEQVRWSQAVGWLVAFKPKTQKDRSSFSSKGFIGCHKKKEKGCWLVGLVGLVGYDALPPMIPRAACHLPGGLQGSGSPALDLCVLRSATVLGCAYCSALCCVPGSTHSTTLAVQGCGRDGPLCCSLLPLL